MVRHYRPKNPFRKASKLSPEQTALLMLGFFIPDNVPHIARTAQCSERTVRATFAAINDRILTDLECRTALIDFLSPEIEGFHWISRNVDLSRQSPFWGNLRTCFFACPAQMDASILMTQLRSVEALAFAKELQVTKGRVTMLRVQCAACPAKWILEHISAAYMVPAKSLMIRWRMTSPRQFRQHFFQCVFAAGIRLRAEASTSTSDDLAQHGVRINRYARDLTIILASHLRKQPLVKS